MNPLHNKGFTFIEIVVATLLIAILAAGMFGAFVGANYIYNRARHRNQAFNFAREALDRLRSNYQYNSSPAMTVGTNKPESNIGTIVRGEMASLNTELTYDVSEEPGGGYKEVEISVKWDEASF